MGKFQADHKEWQAKYHKEGRNPFTPIGSGLGEGGKLREGAK